MRERFIGSFVVGPHTMTPARVRELSAPVVENWVSKREQQLVRQVSQEPPDEFAIGVSACLAAVSQHAVAVLVLPVGGLMPGFACDVCDTLASTPDGCPHGPSAVHPVPDLLEEMALAALDGGGEVAAVRDPPADLAARLRFPLAQVPDVT